MKVMSEALRKVIKRMHFPPEMMLTCVIAVSVRASLTALVTHRSLHSES